MTHEGTPGGPPKGATHHLPGREMVYNLRSPRRIRRGPPQLRVARTLRCGRLSNHRRGCRWMGTTDAWRKIVGSHPVHANSIDLAVVLHCCGGVMHGDCAQWPAAGETGRRPHWPARAGPLEQKGRGGASTRVNWLVCAGGRSRFWLAAAARIRLTEGPRSAEDASRDS